MRNLKNIFFLAVLLFSFTANAQTAKFGHINSSDLLALMPERDQAQSALQAFADELEKQLGIMQDEFEAKYQEYLKLESTMNEVVKATRQQELQDLQTRIQDYQSNAQQQYSKKESELLQPILDKANKAIQEVGKENGYTYIFDVSTGAVVYFAENSDDVMALVKKKLGIVDKE